MSRKSARLTAWERVRTTARTRLTPTALASLDAAGLLALQDRLGFGAIWGTIAIPTTYLPRGTARSTGARTAKLRDHFERAGVPESLVDECVELVTRLALIRLLVPLPGFGRGTAPLVALSTWIKVAKALTKVIGLAALRRRGERASSLLSHLTLEDFASVRVVRPHVLYATFARYKALGLVPDWPTLDEEKAISPLEQDRKNAPGPDRFPRTTAEHLPFPDAFVAEAGWRIAWIIRNLSPTLLDLAQELASVRLGPASRTHRSHDTLLSKAKKRLVRQWNWRDQSGEEIAHLPFDVLTTTGKPIPWPPRTLKQVNALLSLLQGADLFSALLSFGARASEALSMPVGALTEIDESQRISGRTFKLEFRREGALIDWPVPELVGIAIRNQERLRRVIGALDLQLSSRRAQQLSDDYDTIWVRLRSRNRAHGQPGDEMLWPNSVIEHLVKRLGLLGYLDSNHRTNPHRFRKTIARLIALALVNAPKILMDLFGHESIKMTIHYMLADKNIRAEMEEVAAAQVVMFAARAIENADTNGGPAAERIREARDAAMRAAQLSARHFGTDDIYELADILTLGGRYCQIVRRGVLCTKLPTQTGACNKSIGDPDPSRCRSKCAHRLEEAMQIDDVDGAVAQAVEQAERALENDDQYSVAFWTGQIVANVDRFSNLREKWIAHPTICRLGIGR